MIHSGLVSITLRQLSPKELVDLVTSAGLEAIEWGGDIHVPHGDLTKAAEVRQMTKQAGLVVASYGSYYRLGEEENLSFEKVLETAVELGAPSIRVWAGRKKLDEEVDPKYFDFIVNESRRIADLAAKAKIVVSYEFHRMTLTETNALTKKLMETVRHDNIKTLWQPPVASTLEYCMEGLDIVMPWLENVHVFQWDDNPDIRFLLAEGNNVWPKYLQKIASNGRDHFALIEFVKDDDPANFLKDTETSMWRR